MAENREILRDSIIEALVGLIRTGGTESFPVISGKDRAFFRGLAVYGTPDASPELLEKTGEEIRAMRKKLTAPKCAGCGGAPDLTGEFHMADLRNDEFEVRALKHLILDALTGLAVPVNRALEAHVTDPDRNAAFYRLMFCIGEDFAEEDLLQAAYNTERMREEIRKNLAAYL